MPIKLGTRIASLAAAAAIVSLLGTAVPASVEPGEARLLFEARVSGAVLSPANEDSSSKQVFITSGTAGIFDNSRLRITLSPPGAAELPSPQGEKGEITRAADCGFREANGMARWIHASDGMK